MTDFCHKYDPPVCKNHAVCAYKNEPPFYSCLCLPGFTGTNCEIKGFVNFYFNKN